MKKIGLLLIVSMISAGCCELCRIPAYCHPDADFSSDVSTVSVNEAVQFMDQSYGDPDTWNWTFTGGTPANSAARNPKVFYNSPGTYAVSLSIHNRKGTNTEEKLSFIKVNPQTECEEVTFMPGPFIRLCPTHINGDTEFAGHGPSIQASAKLRIVNNKQIYADLSLHAKETTPDWTEGTGNWTELVYSAPSDWSIKSIITDIISTASFTDADLDLDVPVINQGYLVSRFEIMGDTWGLDIDSCAINKTFLDVYFNEVTVRICKDQN